MRCCKAVLQVQHNSSGLWLVIKSLAVTGSLVIITFPLYICKSKEVLFILLCASHAKVSVYELISGENTVSGVLLIISISILGDVLSSIVTRIKDWCGYQISLLQYTLQTQRSLSPPSPAPTHSPMHTHLSQCAINQSKLLKFLQSTSHIFLVVYKPKNFFFTCRYFQF